MLGKEKTEKKKKKGSKQESVWEEEELQENEKAWKRKGNFEEFC